MGTFLSLCYTAVDTICLILFLDVFEQRRFDGLKFHLHVLEYVLLSCWVPLILSIIVGHNQALKILIILLIDFIIAKRLTLLIFVLKKIYGRIIHGNESKKSNEKIS